MLQSNTSADRVESLLFAYISEQLGLSPMEAEKFRPVYSSYRKELDAIHQQYPSATPSAEQQVKLEQQKLDLKKKYIPQFRAALGTEKLNHLYDVERKFQEKLKEIREQRMQQRPNSPIRPGGHR